MSHVVASSCQGTQLVASEGLQCVVHTIGGILVVNSIMGGIVSNLLSVLHFNSAFCIVFSNFAVEVPGMNEFDPIFYSFQGQ